MRPSLCSFIVILAGTNYVLNTMYEAKESRRIRYGNGVEAASASRSNYNPYQYDLTVPQFTPDGRLLQVEYAQKASTDHSIPIVAAIIHHDKADSKSPLPESITVLVAGRRQAESQQSRLILLPSFSSIVSSIDQDTPSGENGPYNCIVIAISGVLADALSILQSIQAFRIQEYRTMGSGDTDRRATRRIATQIASQCQSRTLAGGRRPLGATFWITTPHNDATNGAVVHQTDPSGALHDVALHGPYNSVAVLGGGDAGTKIQRRLQKEWVHQDSSEDQSAKQRIGRLLHIVMEEYQNADDDHGTRDKSDDSTLNRLEVVIMSSKRGAIKLTPLEIRTLVEGL